MKLPYNISSIHAAMAKGAHIYASVSGGKDGQAMCTFLHAMYLPIHGIVHADLGRVEWKESIVQCERIAAKHDTPLHIVRRTDGRDLLDHWRHRMVQLKGTGKPFWSSAKSRYCTSDLKRDPIDKFFRNSGHNFIISAEGIRADESTKRKQKKPLSIRSRITHPYYKGMSVEQAIENYNPAYRLALTWFPVFHFSLADVWATEGLDQLDLDSFRRIYKQYGYVPHRWTFHPAYAYGNNRVSCMLCILGSLNDLQVGAEHNPTLLDAMIALEDEGEATFKNDFSLKQLINKT